MNETPSISDQDAALLRSALDKSEEELYVQFGQANYLGAGPASVRDLLNRGKQVLDARKKDLQNIVCQNTIVQSVADRDDPYQVAVAVFVVLATLVPNPEAAPLVTLAALITKIGIKTLCESVWDEQNRGDS